MGQQLNQGFIGSLLRLRADGADLVRGLYLKAVTAKQPPASQVLATRYRMVFAVDIVGYSKLTAWQQQKYHRRLHDVIEEVLLDLLLTLPGNDRKDTGDGWIIFLPVELDPTRALPTLIRATAARISADNSTESPRLRLRLAIGMGLVVPGPSIFSGAAVVEVVRLLECAAIRREICEHPTTDLAVIVSDRLYSDIAGIGNSGIPADRFHRVRAVAKGFDQIAWLWRAAG
ncbi:MAG TPA: hypothetical protein VJX66_31570 [Amycolatopsis sp.]|nr:hypothetical protein [Amycolatopsis sp.]